MEIFTAFAGELERSIAWGSGGFTTLGGAVARVQRKSHALKYGNIYWRTSVGGSAITELVA